MQTDSLDPDKITEHLATKRIGRKVVVFKSTQSTNSIAAEYAKNIENDGLSLPSHATIIAVNPYPALIVSG